MYHDRGNPLRPFHVTGNGHVGATKPKVDQFRGRYLHNPEDSLVWAFLNFGVAISILLQLFSEAKKECLFPAHRSDELFASLGKVRYLFFFECF